MTPTHPNLKKENIFLLRWKLITFLFNFLFFFFFWFVLVSIFIGRKISCWCNSYSYQQPTQQKCPITHEVVALECCTSDYFSAKCWFWSLTRTYELSALNIVSITCRISISSRWAETKKNDEKSIFANDIVNFSY